MNTVKLLSRSENFGASKHEKIPNLQSINPGFVLPSFSLSDTTKKTYVLSPFDRDTLKLEATAVYLKDAAWDRTVPVSNRFGYIDNVREAVSSEEGICLIIVGGLEYCDDVRPLLVRAREILLSGGAVELVGGFSGGYWQWSLAEMQALLAAAGLTSTVKEESPDIYHLSLSCTPASLSKFYNDNHLPQPTFKHLIVTTEHSGYRVTGGIGSYVKECDVLYGPDGAVLIIDNNNTIDMEKIHRNKWLAAQTFLSKERIATIEHTNFDTMGDLVEEVLECLLVLYPQLESIESQEMLLNRTIEAKRSGFISKDIKLITTCHGSSFHLAKAKRSVLDAENIHTAYREKFSIEESDSVIFPTHFLKASYKDSGIAGLDDPSRVIKRLPFDTSRLPEGETLRSYRRLIYIGKTSTIKGFDLFLETLNYLYEHQQDFMGQIEEVVVMATSTHIQERHLQQLFSLTESRMNIRMVSLDREELLRTLSEYSRDSLALITYQGDNHPLAVLELMAIGHDFVAANAGGTPELILPGHEKEFLVAPTPEAFSSFVIEASGQSMKRSEMIRDVRKEYLKQQDAINKTYSLDYIRQLPERALPPMREYPVDIKVQVIAPNGQDDNLKKTLYSLEQQTRLANKVHVIHSPSSPDEQCQIRLYAGDVLYPYAIELLSQKIESDATCTVAMGYEYCYAYEGGKRKGVEEFHPYAPELGSVFLQEKYSRRMVGLILSRNIEQPSLSDWQNAIQSASQRQRVGVVPRLIMELAEVKGYPDTDILRQSHQYASSFSALPVFDATILYSQLKRFDDIYWGLQRLNHLEDHFVPRSEANPYVSPRVVRVIGAYHRFTPSIVQKTVRVVVGGVFTVLRSVKKVVR